MRAAAILPPLWDVQVSRAPRGSALSGGQGDLRMVARSAGWGVRPEGPRARSARAPPTPLALARESPSPTRGEG